MRKWMPFALILIAIALSLATASRLPSSVATHWNWLGQVDGRASKGLALTVIPAAMIFVVALLLFLPRLDPIRENFQKFWPEYQLIVCGIAALMLVMHAAMIANALDWRINMIRLSSMLTGLLFLVIGNVLPRLRRNHIAGFRTAATLSSDAIWARTHRIGGAVMMAVGIIIGLASFAPLPWGLPVIIAIALASMFGILMYASRIPPETPSTSPPSR